MIDLRALWWITLDLIRRLLREPQVVRSLLWPIGVGPVTIMLTVLAFVWVEGDWPVAIASDLDPTLTVELREAGFQLTEVQDPRQAVATEGYRIGIQGRTVYAVGIRGRVLQVERVLREHYHAPWQPTKKPGLTADKSGSSKMIGVMGILFSIFGVVFGAGMVARDRDDGTLEAELTLGVRRWVHGTARWIAGTTVLLVHYALAILVINAIMGFEELGPTVRNGVAACGASVAIGLLVVGRAGLKAGFSAPLARGLTAATGLAGVGLAAPTLGQHLPIASLVTSSPGWSPLGVSTLISLAAIAAFTLRSARA